MPSKIAADFQARAILAGKLGGQRRQSLAIN
jgi:hypothetical protein